MAEIDKRFYRGTDAYSDGDEAEETLRRLTAEGKTLAELEVEEVSWPVFYHLSPLRENICNWYPFAPGSRVLEIGSGCGAVTGALCGRGLEVTAVDLSLRRSTINLTRHKDCPELRLIAGNLNEVEFPEKFDYVLLIGVLEYAGRFTEGKTPFRTFLENIRKLMKPEGILLTAIENRLGLKYFAGAPEDHLGEAFAGLRGYDPAEGIRTFSRSELKTLMEESGFGATRFYYPYPDYKFPLEIFTEETLKTQHYGKPFLAYDAERAEIFPEAEVASALAEDGAAGALANSFLVEAAAGGKALPETRVLYAKLNADRREAFRIGTRILGKTAPETVSKFALTAAAGAHLARMAENEEKLGRSGRVLRGTAGKNEITYPFSPLRTMEDLLREAWQREDAQGILNGFMRIRKEAFPQTAVRNYDTPAFTEWFGEARTEKTETLCAEPANIDLMTDNLFADEDRLIMTDCEWVTDFPAPVGFILWRSVENLWARIREPEKVIRKEEILRALEIREEDIPVFREWNRHFENHYAAERSGSRFAKEIRMTEFTPRKAEEMRQELTNREAHIEKLMASERELAGEVKSQEAHIGQLMQSERELAGKAKSQEAHIDQLITSERELKGIIAEKDAQIESLQKELKDVYASRSWRMTAGLRKAEETYRNMKNGKNESKND